MKKYNTKISNLSTEEWVALKSLSKRKDVVIKAADKDFTSANQETVQKTIQDLIDKQELPVTAKSLIVTTPRTSRIYFKPKFTNQTILADQLFVPVVALLNRQDYGAYC